MDNQASRNTFSIKFLIHNEIQQNLIRISLIENLRQAIDLYCKTKNINIDLESNPTILERKITLLFARSFHIVYRCAIAFPLAKYIGLSPSIIARELAAIIAAVALEPEKDNLEFELTVNLGVIDLYCTELTLARWLEYAVANLSRCQPLPFTSMSPNTSTQRDLFFLHYAHARCCSWLRLGARENLIELSDRTFATLIWQIAQPQPLVWLDDAGKFYLTHRAEYRLLFQLLTAIETSANNTENWQKVALNLSEAMLVFEAQCRIFGAVRQNSPQLAIARLGLVALVQYYLQKLLWRDKVKALSEL